MEENKNLINEQEMSNTDDALKSAIEAQLSKIRSQSMALGFRVACSTIKDKIDAFKRTQGAKSNNDHKRLIKDINKFVETGLSRKMNENGEVEVSEETESITEQN